MVIKNRTGVCGVFDRCHYTDDQRALEQNSCAAYCSAADNPGSCIDPVVVKTRIKAENEKDKER